MDTAGGIAFKCLPILVLSTTVRVKEEAGLASCSTYVSFISSVFSLALVSNDVHTVFSFQCRLQVRRDFLMEINCFISSFDVANQAAETALTDSSTTQMALDVPTF